MEHKILGLIPKTICMRMQKAFKAGKYLSSIHVLAGNEI